MKQAGKYVLGESACAARRLEIQDAHLAEASERLLDSLTLRPQDRVVELGCGPGGFSSRIIRRLGERGVLISVDSSAGLLAQARERLSDCGPARFEPILADIAELGPWLDGADVVVGRAVLHHIPMAELLLGRLHAALRSGTRVGFLEPDFRAPLARLAYLEVTGRPDLMPLRRWAVAINQLYQASRLSPAVGATLAAALESTGYRQVQATWFECRSDSLMLENMWMLYDEVGDRLQTLGILTREEIQQQQELLKRLPADGLPAMWRTICVAGVV